jgi:hypothetical protein
MPRISIHVPEGLLRRCEKDAREMEVSLSMYFRRLAEDRHGLSKIGSAPPRDAPPSGPMPQVRAQVGQGVREWDCPKCHDVNSQSLAQCLMCGEPRPDVDEEPSEFVRQVERQILGKG